MSPVDLVISRFSTAGIGIRKLSRLLGGSDYRVSLWKIRGDHVPTCGDMHARLLALAKERGVRLTARELIGEG